MFTLSFLIIPAMAISAIDEDFFPILAWGGTPGDPDVLKEIADCGINVVGFVSPQNLDMYTKPG